MKKINCYSLIFILLFGLSIQAQTNNGTLEECVKYAIANNISIKQTELDTKTARYWQKGSIGNFIPSLNLQCFSLLEQWFKSRPHHDEFWEIKPLNIPQWEQALVLIFTKGCKIKTRFEKPDLFDYCYQIPIDKNAGRCGFKCC